MVLRNKNVVYLLNLIAWMLREWTSMFSKFIHDFVVIGWWPILLTVVIKEDLFVALKNVIFWCERSMTLTVSILLPNYRRNVTEIPNHFMLVRWWRRTCNGIRLHLIVMQVIRMLWGWLKVKVVSWWNLLITAGIIYSHKRLMLFLSCRSKNLVVFKLVRLCIRLLKLNRMYWVWNVILCHALSQIVIG